MKRNYYQACITGIVIVISWITPLYAVPTPKFSIEEVTCCSLYDDEKELLDNLHYISDAVSTDTYSPNSLGSFTVHGVTVNMTGDMVYGALPMKSMVDKNTIIAFSQDATGASEPIPEPATLLLIGTGLLCAVGISRKMNYNFGKLGGNNKIIDDEELEDVNYCDYLDDADIKDSSRSKKK